MITGRVAAVTVKAVVLEPVPLGAVTVTRPLAAPEGTVKVSWVALKTMNATDCPFNLTEVASKKLEPFTVMIAPTGPLEGEKEVTTGDGGSVTVNTAELTPVPP